MIRSVFFIALLSLLATCGCSSKGEATSTNGSLPASAGPSTPETGAGSSGGVPATPGSAEGETTGAASTATASGAVTPSQTVPPPAAGATPGNGTTAAPGTTGGTAPVAGGSGTGVAGGTAPNTAGAPGSATAGDTPVGAGDTPVGAGDTPEGDPTADTTAGTESEGQDAGAGAGQPGGSAGGETDVGADAGSDTSSPTDVVENSPSTCIGEIWPSADPTKAGPFKVAADKNVGPLAGALPDPIYGDQQQRFNVYRPDNLADSGRCHPILIWANGYRDNPEQNPPDCVVDSGSNQWCGQYSPLLNHLASHGFVVVASLSTATAEGDPLPTIAGLDWILEQAEDPSSPYYGRLDTANIGQLGHSYGGMSTCMSASEPRYSALATICGTRALEGVHTPMLFFCGGNDSTVNCSGVKDTFLTVTNQPAFFLNELGADHGSWVYQGAGGVSLSSAAAWFRVHLMDDTENRKFFYGPGCTFCSDGRVQVEQNSLMAQ